MANLNKVFLMGNLTRDPDIRYTQSGLAICHLGLAVNRRYQARSGEEVEEVCFVDIEVFGKQAESCKNYLQRGAPALIEGRLKLDTWEDRNSGEKRSRLRVVGERVQFLGPPSRGSGFSNGPPQQQSNPQMNRNSGSDQSHQQAPARPQGMQKAQSQMPEFDTSGFEDEGSGNGDFAVGDDDVPDQIPF